MAEAVIVSIAEMIVANLASQAINEVGMLCGVKHELKALQNAVSTLQAELEDAQERYYQHPKIQNWVERLKDAFYDAQDVLEESNIEAKRRELSGHNCMFKEVRTFFSSSNQLAFILQMSCKVKAVRKKIEAIKADKEFHSNNYPKREWSRRQETYSFIHEGDIIGREDDKMRIMKFLLDPNVKEKVSILPIVGIGGLGKTSLAQFVYNDKQISEHFHLRMWVYVSEDFDLKKIVKNLIASATEKEPINGALERLQSELRAAIDEKKYLLVLDDLWIDDPEKWRRLKNLLVGCAEGSKILITTRSDSVANIIGTVSLYHLKDLSESASVNLLMQMACRKEEEKQDPEMLAIAKEIARKCSGVPLVVRTVGHLLSFEETKQKWLDFKDHKLPRVTQDEESIKSILKISYDHLPSHLKQCFAFCSLFPKGYKIKKQTLVNLWVAGGFIQPSENLHLEDIENPHLEDIAHRYFTDLLCSSFFQNLKKDPNTNEETCKMHDLMHDLACLVAGTECWVTWNDKKSMHERTRHVSMGDLPISCLKASPLRTLISTMPRMRSEAYLRQLMQSFKRLWILDLHNSYVEKVPRSICKLKYLTYLDLSKNRKLKRLPNSITRLQNLQTLNLNGCSSLKKLPRDIRKLVSLRNLDINGCELLSYVPCGLGQLTSLHRLPRFILPKDKACVKNYGGLGELYGLNNVRGSLCIGNLGHVTDAVEEYKAAKLKDKRFLESLELKWCDSIFEDVIGNKDEALLDGLQPHSNLQKLTIHGYKGESLPRWMMYGLMSSLLNLVEVHFYRFGRCQRLPALGQLPHLKVLAIRKLIELDSIELDYSSNLRALFPSLLKLEIYNCSKLRAMPLTSHPRELELTKANIASMDNISGQRMQHLFNLVDLIICRCNELDLSKDESGNILNFQGLQSLRSVRIQDLPKLASLPLWLLQASNLERLSILRCENLKDIPEQIEALQSLQRLEIRSFCSLASLPKGIGRLASLTNLIIWDCNGLDISKDERGNILDFHGGLQSLRSVEICNLPKLESLPQWLLQLNNLEHLKIYKCCNLKALSEQIKALQSLQRLLISDCPSLTSLPEGMRTLASLTHLDIFRCKELHSSKDESGNIILDFHGGLQSLRSVRFIGLTKLESLPQWLLQARNLEHLDIGYCNDLKALPERIENLRSLQQLDIVSCGSLTSLPEGMRGLASSLTDLRISGCKELDLSIDEKGNILDFHGGLQSLRSVYFNEIPKLESLPQWLLQARNLERLDIWCCNHLKALPERIEALQSLQQLDIRGCPSLTSLPEGMRGLASLTHLQIIRCPELKKRCKRDAGEDWDKIAHIPNIDIHM